MEKADGYLAAQQLLSPTQKYPHLICVQGHPTNIHLNSGHLCHLSSPFPPLSSTTLKGMKHFYVIKCHVIKIVLTSIFKNGQLIDCVPNETFKHFKEIPDSKRFSFLVWFGLVFP